MNQKNSNLNSKIQILKKYLNKTDNNDIEINHKHNNVSNNNKIYDLDDENQIRKIKLFDFENKFTKNVYDDNSESASLYKKDTKDKKYRHEEDDFSKGQIFVNDFLNKKRYDSDSDFDVDDREKNSLIIESSKPNNNKDKNEVNNTSLILNFDSDGDIILYNKNKLKDVNNNIINNNCDSTKNNTIFYDKKGNFLSQDGNTQHEINKKVLDDFNKDILKLWSMGSKQLEDSLLKSEKEKLNEKIKNKEINIDLLSKTNNSKIKAYDYLDDPMKELIKNNLILNSKEISIKDILLLDKPKLTLGLKCPFPGLTNRFDIEPGHLWDGDDRSNGYEKKYLKATNENAEKRYLNFKFRTEDM